MAVKRKLLPGEPGTKRLLKKYGESLLCVRYRYDAERHVRMTTVELVEDESPWQRRASRIPANKIVNIAVTYTEEEIRRLVKAAGGRWNPEKKLWELAYKEVLNLGFEDRIVP